MWLITTKNMVFDSDIFCDPFDISGLDLQLLGLRCQELSFQFLTAWWLSSVRLFRLPDLPGPGFLNESWWVWTDQTQTLLDLNKGQKNDAWLNQACSMNHIGHVRLSCCWRCFNGNTVFPGLYIFLAFFAVKPMFCVDVFGPFWFILLLVQISQFTICGRFRGPILVAGAVLHCRPMRHVELAKRRCRDIWTPSPAQWLGM